MILSRRVFLGCIILAVVACSTEPPTDSAGAWVGTITTEGNVTIVVNESGSVWGGSAALVEEASIGGEAGADEYLLGQVRGVAFNGGRIYVLDAQVPILRVYDLQGRHDTDIGGEGQGPGEFVRPNSVAVAHEGRVFVRDQGLGRINVYGADGQVRDTLAIASNFGSSRQDVAAVDGIVYTPVRVGGGDLAESRTGMQGFQPDGSALDPVVPPPIPVPDSHVVVRRGGGTTMIPVPFAPGYVWTMTYEGAFIVGVGDAYEFEVARPDGTKLVVRRLIDPVVVESDERDYYAGVLRERVQRVARGTGSIEGADPNTLPEVKPFFYDFVSGRGGKTWVLREGPGKRGDDCGEGEEPGSCWRRTVIVDAFDADGRFLGEVALPEGMQLSPSPALRDDVLVAVAEDDAGTIMVKRYRLVLPGEK